MSVRNMTRCALFAALLTVCAWISVPVGELAISLQTFGVLLTLGILGGKRGGAAILVYLALGAIGLPVFTGFRGGIGILLGPTGGYLWGFLAAGLLYWLLERKIPLWINFLLALMLCYVCGTAWYYFAFQGDFWAVAAMCVVPYLLPDGLKFAIALLLSRRLKKYA